MLKNKLLSICIPTCNRAPYLKEALESVLAQLHAQNQNLVEIVVSDNASRDETAELVAELKKNSRVLIRYHCQSVNVGFDRNILKVVSLAQGDFCWILADDDRIAKGAVSLVLRAIQQQPGVDVFLGNRENYDLAFSRKLRFFSVLKPNQTGKYDFQKDQIRTYLKRVKRLLGVFSYLSTQVFKRETWLRNSEAPIFLGSEYIHVYVFMSMLWGAQRGILQYLPERIVETRWGNDAALQGGKDEIFRRLRKDVEAFHNIALAVLKQPTLVRCVDNLLLVNDGFSWAVRSKIVDSRQFYFQTLPFLFSYYWRYLLFWLKIFPLCFVPSFLLNLMQRAYRRHIKKERI